VNLLALKSDLRRLSKVQRREVQLIAGDLADGYRALLAKAPSRTQGYLSSRRAGCTSTGETTNGMEEHPAVALFNGKELVLPDGERLQLLDDQFPLKSVRGGLKIPTFDGHLNESNTVLRRCSMEYTPRRKLSREFKLEAVRQAALSEKPKAQLARELGVRVGQLRTWRLEFEKEAVTGIAKPDRSAAEDLEQLRRENAKLKMEIEILKKAAIYFAREAK